MWPTMMAGPSSPGVGAPVYQPTGNAAGGTCSDPSASSPKSISVLSTPIDGTCTRTGADLLMGFAIGSCARSAAVATDDGTSGADGRMESIGESDTGADARADETGTDATADDCTGATEGPADLDVDVPHPATNTAAIAAPTAMRTVGFIADDDGRQRRTPSGRVRPRQSQQPRLAACSRSRAGSSCRHRCARHRPARARSAVRQAQLLQRLRPELPRPSTPPPTSMLRSLVLRRPTSMLLRRTPMPQE